MFSVPLALLHFSGENSRWLLLTLGTFLWACAECLPSFHSSKPALLPGFEQVQLPGQKQKKHMAFFWERILQDGQLVSPQIHKHTNTQRETLLLARLQITGPNFCLSLHKVPLTSYEILALALERGFFLAKTIIWSRKVKVISVRDPGLHQVLQGGRVM